MFTNIARVLLNAHKNITCSEVRSSVVNKFVLVQLKYFSTSKSKRRKVINLSYVSYESTEESRKPPIFIFHGILGSKAQWEMIGKTIQNVTHRKVVAVDLRNHGNSPHDESHRYTEQAIDVLKLLERMEARQASLIGHSIGGRTAMCVALMAPHKVTGLQVIDISPMSTPYYFSQMLPIMLWTMKNIRFDETNMVSAAKAQVRKKLTKYVNDENMMNSVLSNIRRQPDGGIGWTCNLDALINHYKYWISFPRVSDGLVYKGPTMFVGGQLSNFVPPDELSSIRYLFPEAVIAYVQRSGHYAHIDNPKMFLDLTIDFLNTHKYRNTTTKSGK